MARTQSRPATAGAFLPPVPPDDEALLQEVCTDALKANQALASVLALLKGCPADHQLRAGVLAALLEPIAGCLDTLCCDLGTVSRTGALQ